MNAGIKAHLNSTEPSAVAVLARAISLRADTPDLVYMPDGKNEIEASANGKPERLTVKVDATTAVRLQADLAARLATGIQPTLDYNHEGGKASAWPQAFTYEAGIGVICRVQWTEPAAAAIRAGEWKYFSPEFRYDRKTKTVLGLRATGPIGGLVNDPAFRAMPAVQARHQKPLPDNPEPTPPPTKKTHMNETIVAALHAAGIISITEAATDSAPAIVTARIAEIGSKAVADIKAAHATELAARDTEIAALKADINKAAEAAAEIEITAAVNTGRIPAKDSVSMAFWKSSIVANGETAIKALRAIPANPALRPTGARSQEEAASNKEDETFYVAVSAKAREIERTTGLTFSEAFKQAEAEFKATS